MTSTWKASAWVSLVTALLLVLAPAAAHASQGGIAGTVHETVTHDPIQGVRVCAWAISPTVSEEEGEEEASIGGLGCATTGASGEYAIGGLSAGSYLVEFLVPAALNLNLIDQYYDDKLLIQEPTDVSVAESATTAGVDAELEPGAELSGTVTEAGSGTALEGAEVCGLEPDWEGHPAAVGCALTGSGGSFAILGLPEGSFDIVVVYDKNEELGVGYLGGTTISEATPIKLAAHEVMTGVKVVVALKYFSLSERSSGSGGSADTPGTPDVGGEGTGRTSSAGLSLMGRRIAVRRDGDARVEVACAGSAACQGRLVLRATGTFRRDGRLRRKTTVLGAAPYTLKAGERKTLTIRLDAVARRVLHARRGRLSSRVSLVQSTPAPGTVSVGDVLLVAVGDGR